MSPEDDAADRLADAFAAPRLVAPRAGTGRVNLHGRRAGLLRVDAAAVDAVNAVDEALTVGTLPDYASGGAARDGGDDQDHSIRGAGRVLAEAERVRAAPPALRLHPFRPLRGRPRDDELAGDEAQYPGRHGGGDVDAASPGLAGTLLPPLECAARRGADRRRVAGAAGPGCRYPAGGGRQRGGGPARCRAGGDRGGRGRDPAFRHAGRSRQPDLPGADRDTSGAGAARAARAARS